MPKRAEYGVYRTPEAHFKLCKWGVDENVEPDTQEWFDLVQSLTSFNFRGRDGQFTARRELRKGKPYWYAFRRTDIGVQKMYLGKTEDLTISNLDAIHYRLIHKEKNKKLQIELSKRLPLEVGSSCYILGHKSNTDSRYRHGRVVTIVELPTSRRRSYKVTDIARPGSYYLYYGLADLIRTDDPDALKKVRETV